MPFLTIRNTNLLNSGPLIEVAIGPSMPIAQQLAEQGKPILGCKAIALIDTGASSTCISDEIVGRLSLIPFDVQKIHTAGGISEQNLYDITIKLPDKVTKLIPVQAPCADLSGQPFQVLLGRDILSICTMFYNGADNSFCLHF